MRSHRVDVEPPPVQQKSAACRRLEHFITGVKVDDPHLQIEEDVVLDGFHNFLRASERLVGDKAAIIGVKEVEVVIRGVGAGRESALRGFASKGIDVTKISDDTPVPHNGPRPPKPRRI